MNPAWVVCPVLPSCPSCPLDLTRRKLSNTAVQALITTAGCLVPDIGLRGWCGGLSKLGILPVISIGLGIHFFYVSPSIIVHRFCTWPLISHSLSLSLSLSFFLIIFYSPFIFLCVFLPPLSLHIDFCFSVSVFPPSIPVCPSLHSLSHTSLSVSFAKSSICSTFTESHFIPLPTSLSFFYLSPFLCI